MASPPPVGGELLGEEGGEELLLAPLHLPLGERPEGEEGHAAHQVLRGLGQGQEVGRAREEEAPRAPVPVHPGLQGEEEARGPLHLVQDHPALEAGEEPLGVQLGRGEEGEVVQGEVAVQKPLRHQGLGQGGLPHLPPPEEEDHGAVLEGLFDGDGQVPGKHGPL